MPLFKKDKRAAPGNAPSGHPSGDTIFPEDFLFNERKQQAAQQQQQQRYANASGRPGSSNGFQSEWNRSADGYDRSPALSHSGTFSSSGGGGAYNPMSGSSTYLPPPVLAGTPNPASMGPGGLGSGRKSKLERLTGEDAPVLKQGAPPTAAGAAMATNAAVGRAPSRTDTIGTASTGSDRLYTKSQAQQGSKSGGPSRSGSLLTGTRSALGHAHAGSQNMNGAGPGGARSPNTGMHQSQMSFGGTSTSMSHHPRPSGGGVGRTSMLDTSPEETDCPVCLEPLSHRLAGEKSHVVPQCGHALHNACFTAVYGSPETVMAMQKRNAMISTAQNRDPSKREQYQASQAPGMCGVCRKAIILGEGDQSEKRTAKATGMMGMAGPTPSDSQPTRDDDKGDDRLDLSSYARYQAQSQGVGMVVPIIRARPEYPTIYRRDPSGRTSKQNVVCVVSVEAPGRRPPPVLDENYYSQAFSHAHNASSYDRETYDDDELTMADNASSQAHGRSRANTYDSQDLPRPTGVASLETQLREVPEEAMEEPQTATNGVASGNQSENEDGTGFSYRATPSAQDAKNDPHNAAITDLRTRIVDWKGHTLEHFGPLHLYDTLNVRQDTVVREFSVYLFQEALLCVTEERKRGLGKLVAAVGQDEAQKPGLKLKGRIYIRHIQQVLDTSAAGEPSLSIKMDDEHLDQFVLCFSSDAQAAAWRHKLEDLVEYVKNPDHVLTVPPATSGGTAMQQKSSGGHGSDMNQSASASESSLTAVTRIPDTTSSQDHTGSFAKHIESKKERGASMISGKAGSAGDAASIADSTGTRKSLRKSNKLGSDTRRSSVITGSKVPIMPLHQQWSASGGHDPSKPIPELLPHAPLDLVIMISIPVVVEAHPHVSASISSSAALKLRLIRSSLEFIVNNLGPSDRICLVSYTVGMEGQVRKTQFLQASKESSRRKLHAFIEGMGSNDASESDPFLEDLSKLGGSSERIDTVTAINVGLDVVLQRKSKIPTTGMILVNDTASGPKRNQMDLVMARAEAANVPIHCFGYGKNHDPSSLWLISNHTKGTYTFVKEWFQLRECLAGCIGSLMSVALTDVKVHISLPADNKFRVRKVSGVIGSIVSANGKDVDIEVGYVHFGDVREFFVELEVDFAELMAYLAPPELSKKAAGKKKQFGPARPEESSATDDFMARLGIQGLSLDGEGAGGDMEGVLGSFIEEVAVLEIDAGFKDPASYQAVTRMVNPTILTMEVDSTSQDPTIAENSAAVVASLADPTVTRRRIEILVSDMITRSLLLVSRKNHAQAQRILTETRRVVETVVNSIPVPAHETAAAALSVRGAGMSRVGGPRRQRELLHAQTLESLNALLDDLDTLVDGLENSKTSFERDTKNFGAQQAMVLRDQKAWTTRTNTEFIRFRDDNGSAFAAHAYVHSLPGR